MKMRWRFEESEIERRTLKSLLDVAAIGVKIELNSVEGDVLVGEELLGSLAVGAVAVATKRGRE